MWSSDVGLPWPWSWSESLPPCPPCMPPIMNSIISGQASTSAANSSVDAGTPSATSPTTRIASAIAYRPQGWRLMASPFPLPTFPPCSQIPGGGMGQRHVGPGPKVPPCRVLPSGRRCRDGLSRHGVGPVSGLVGAQFLTSPVRDSSASRRRQCSRSGVGDQAGGSAGSVADGVLGAVPGGRQVPDAPLVDDIGGGADPCPDGVGELAEQGRPAALRRRPGSAGRAARPPVAGRPEPARAVAAAQPADPSGEGGEAAVEGQVPRGEEALQLGRVQVRPAVGEQRADQPGAQRNGERILAGAGDRGGCRLSGEVGADQVRQRAGHRSCPPSRAVSAGAACAFPSRGRKPRSRRLLDTTNTELNAIAVPAIMGLSTPAAASGRAAML